MSYSGCMTITRPQWIWFALACAVGLLSAIVALHTDNLQFAVTFVFVHCTVFGYAQPRRAWRWACLIAVWIPLTLLFNCFVTLPGPRELGVLTRLYLGPVVVFFKSPVPVPLKGVPASCMSLIPAMAGAYVGAWMSRVAGSRPGSVTSS